MSEESGKEMPVSGGSKSALNGHTLPGIETRSEMMEVSPSMAPQPSTETKAERYSSEHSPWPMALAAGLLLVAVGILNQWIVAALGGIVVFVAIVSWMWQPWVS